MKVEVFTSGLAVGESEVSLACLKTMVLISVVVTSEQHAEDHETPHTFGTESFSRFWVSLPRR